VGKNVKCNVSPSTRKRSARLVRHGRTYASGTTARLKVVRRVRPGNYTLVIGSGRKATKLAVTV
jgi:hypothetical protein